MFLLSSISFSFFPSGCRIGELLALTKLTEQGRKLTAKVDGQQVQINRLTNKVMEQSNLIDRLQEKASDLEHLERHLGREQV